MYLAVDARPNLTDFGAHNVVFQVAAETGIVGLVILLYFGRTIATAVGGAKTPLNWFKLFSVLGLVYWVARRCQQVWPCLVRRYWDHWV